MKLEIVLQDLLQRTNVVALPGFGIFYSRYQAARIIKSDHVKFIPPHTFVEFESNENIDDSPLASILETEYNISFSDAVLEIQSFIHRIKAAITRSNSYVIEGVGTLVSNEKGIIELQTDTQSDFSYNTYGLSDFQVYTIPKKDALERVIQKRAQKTDSTQKKVLKALFIAIPIFFALVLIPNILHISQSASIVSLFRNTQVIYDMSNPYKPAPPDITSAYFHNSEPSNSVYDMPLGTETPPPQTHVVEQTTNPSSLKNQQFSDSSSTKQSTNHMQTTETVESTEQFYIIVGSFSSQQNATRFADELQKTSHNAGVVVSNNKIRVYISQSESKDVALTELETIRTNPKFSGAWLYAES